MLLNGLTGEELTKKGAERMATDEYRTLVDSEVVASLIGERLTNEKFLQKYAQKDDTMIKKIFRFLKSTAGYLKDKDKTARGEVLELVNMFSGVITIEELTVVERVGHQDTKASSDSTSSAVSSEYIISQFRELVKENKEKRSTAETAGLPKASLSPTNNTSTISIPQNSDLSTDYAKNVDGKRETLRRGF